MVLPIYCICFLFAVAVLSIAMTSRFSAKTIDCIPLSALMILSLDSLFGQLTSIAYWAASAYVVSAFNFVFAAALITYKNKKKRISNAASNYLTVSKGLKQSAWTIVSYAIIIAIVIGCALVQFGPSLLLNYASTDPGAHMYEASGIVENGKFGRMFLTHYFTAIWIQLLEAFFPTPETYKAFIIADLIIFTIGFQLVFVTIKTLAGEDRHPALSLVLSALCMLGYPLSDIVFGFSYLNAGAFYTISFLYISLLYKKKSSKVRLACFAISLYGVVISYWIFMPIALIYLVIFYVYLYRKSILRKLPLFIVVGVCVVALCTVALLWIIFSGKLVSLNSRGYSYSDFIGSFLPLIPLASAGILFSLKEKPKNWFQSNAFFITCLLSTIVFLALHISNIISAYYYFKLYYVLWPASFFAVAICFSLPSKELLTLFKLYLGIWVVLLIFSVAGIDDKLSEKYSDLNPSASTNSLFGVYRNNFAQMRADKIPASEVELWKEAYALSKQSDSFVPLLGNNRSVYWYEGTTHNRSEKDFRFFQYWLYPDDERASILIDRLSTVKYVAVLNSAELPLEVSDYLKQHSVVFSNESGAIYNI